MGFSNFMNFSVAFFWRAAASLAVDAASSGSESTSMSSRVFFLRRAGIVLLHGAFAV